MEKKIRKRFYASIKELRKQFDGNNRQISNALADCAAAGKQVASSRKGEEAAYRLGLVACYEIWVRVYGKRKECEKLAESLKFGGRTSEKLINFILRKKLKAKAPYASKLATVIRYAILKRVAGDDLQRFIDKKGGINGCVKAYRDLMTPKESDEAKGNTKNEEEETFEGFLISSAIRNELERHEAQARKSPGYRFAFTFEGVQNGKLRLIAVTEVSAGEVDNGDDGGDNSENNDNGDEDEGDSEEVDRAIKRARAGEALSDDGWDRS